MSAMGGLVAAAMLLLCLLCFGTALSTFEASKELDFPDLLPGSSIGIRSLDGLTLSTQSGELAFCSRVRVPGISRIKNAHRFAHSRKIQVDQIEAVYHPQVAACLHRNVSLGLCECSNDSWKAFQQGSWKASRSPFDTLYLDIKTVDPYTDSSFKVSATEEFHFYHLVFLFVGLGVLLSSEILSSWVPFYYSSAMTLGILLVVLILLYQGMKLLPTGKKSTLSILLYGSLLGFGTVLLQYVGSLLSSALAQIGLGEDVLNPVAVFLPLTIAILGAWLGYWGVRKLVLLEDGRVDLGTAQFVKWALRLAGVTMLLQSSRDDAFAVLITALGAAACWAFGRIDWSSVALWNPFEGMGSYFTSESTPLHYGRRKMLKTQTRTSVLYKSYAQTTVRSPRASSPVSTFSLSPKSPVTKRSISKDREFVSSFLSTPGRKPLTREEYDELGKTCTEDAYKELVASPEFARWLVTQADRISVEPAEPREERPEQEIQMTALMEPSEATPTTSSTKKKRLTRYF